MGFPASPADYRRGNRPTIGLPKIGSMHQRARRASAVNESGVAPAVAPSPPEWTRGASSPGGQGDDPYGRTPRVSRVAMEVSSLGGATRARESPFGRRRRPEAHTVVSSVAYDAITDWEVLLLYRSRAPRL